MQHYCSSFPAVPRWLGGLLLALAVSSGAQAEALPRPDHVVVVIEENRSFAQIMAPRNRESYIHALAQRGMLFTEAYGVTHPSQPNYLALFSGSTQDIDSNTCPLTFSTDNLATALRKAGLSFASYAEGLPAVGDLSCSAGAYQRKHNPVANWQGTRVPTEVNLRFADFPEDFARLPTVALVVPDQDHDMHDGSFDAADTWLRTHLAAYVDWAFQHNSLLILTWDEDNYFDANHIVTLLVGPMVRTGESTQRINHYNVLRTLLDFYGLPPLGASRAATPIEDIWK